MCAPSHGAMLPYGLKVPSPYFPFAAGGNLVHISPLDFQRSQVNDYNVRLQFGLRNYPNSVGLSSFHAYLNDPYAQAYFYKHDPRARFVQEEPKPSHSYIGLIGMAILNSKDKKLVLSDIYQWILDNYPYFRTRGPGWRNSIRHNLSLNDCFIKSGRSANGKGHYWAVHPANVDDFERGDFRRRRAQRKVRRHMGLSVPDDDDSPTPSPTQPWIHHDSSQETDGGSLDPRGLAAEPSPRSPSERSDPENVVTSHSNPAYEPMAIQPRRPSRRRMFDVESLLAPDEEDTDTSSSKEPVQTNMNLSPSGLQPHKTDPNLSGFSRGSDRNSSGAGFQSVPDSEPNSSGTYGSSETPSLLYNQSNRLRSPSCTSVHNLVSLSSVGVHSFAPASFTSVQHFAPSSCRSVHRLAPPAWAVLDDQHLNDDSDEQPDNDDVQVTSGETSPEMQELDICNQMTNGDHLQRVVQVEASSPVSMDHPSPSSPALSGGPDLKDENALDLSTPTHDKRPDEVNNSMELSPGPSGSSAQQREDSDGALLNPTTVYRVSPNSNLGVRPGSQPVDGNPGHNHSLEPELKHPRCDKACDGRQAHQPTAHSPGQLVTHEHADNFNHLSEKSHYYQLQVNDSHRQYLLQHATDPLVRCRRLGLVESSRSSDNNNLLARGLVADNPLFVMDSVRHQHLNWSDRAKSGPASNSRPSAFSSLHVRGQGLYSPYPAPNFQLSPHGLVPAARRPELTDHSLNYLNGLDGISKSSIHSSSSSIHSSSNLS